MHVGLLVKRTRRSCSILIKLEFLDILKKLIYQILKIRPVRVDMLHADYRTDMMKPSVAFISCTNEPI